MTNLLHPVYRYLLRCAHHHEVVFRRMTQGTLVILLHIFFVGLVGDTELYLCVPQVFVLSLALIMVTNSNQSTKTVFPVSWNKYQGRTAFLFFAHCSAVTHHSYNLDVVIAIVI